MIVDFYKMESVCFNAICQLNSLIAHKEILTFAAFLISLQSRGSPGKAKRPDMNNGNIKIITCVCGIGSEGKSTYPSLKEYSVRGDSE
jgi:hypothetical protein